VARICRSQSSKDDQFRQGRGSIPRFGKLPFVICIVVDHLTGCSGGVEHFWILFEHSRNIDEHLPAMICVLLDPGPQSETMRAYHRHLSFRTIISCLQGLAFEASHSYGRAHARFYVVEFRSSLVVVIVSPALGPVTANALAHSCHDHASTILSLDVVSSDRAHHYS
jgi:hypothetical protein